MQLHHRSLRYLVNSMPPKRRPPRKSTFTVRKEEKQRLEREITNLQTQLRALQGEFPVPTNGLTSSAPPQRKLVRDHVVAYMGLRSLLSSYVYSPYALMYSVPIHLPRTDAIRRAILARGSAAQIQFARRCVRERCLAIDLSQPHVATEWFERDDGSMVLMQFDITPFRGIRFNVRDVYDAVGYYAQNVEIYVSERLGDLTIREDDEVGPHATEACVSQRRVMSKTSHGITIDANVVVFRQYFPAGTCPEMLEEHAIFGTQPVESDELYPYVPEERVRHDLDGACMIQQVETRDGERVTTIARMSVITRHSSGGLHPIPEEIQASLRSSAMQWGDLMLLAVRERIYAMAAHRVSTASTASSIPSSPTTESPRRKDTIQAND